MSKRTYSRLSNSISSDLKIPYNQRQMVAFTLCNLKTLVDSP